MTLFADTGSEHAHTSAMNTYRLWKKKRISMASRLALELLEALMVSLEDNLSGLTDTCSLAAKV